METDEIPYFRTILGFNSIFCNLSEIAIIHPLYTTIIFVCSFLEFLELFT